MPSQRNLVTDLGLVVIDPGVLDVRQHLGLQVVIDGAAVLKGGESIDGSGCQLTPTAGSGTFSLSRSSGSDSGSPFRFVITGASSSTARMSQRDFSIALARPELLQVILLLTEVLQGREHLRGRPVGLIQLRPRFARQLLQWRPPSPPSADAGVVHRDALKPNASFEKILTRSPSVKSP